MRLIEVVKEAVKDGDISKVELFLQEPETNVNETDEYLATALHYAVNSGNQEVVDLLLRSGAKVNLQDEFGATPLFEEVIHKHNNIVKLLLENQADPNIADNDGYNCAHQAACNADLEMLNYW